MPKKTARSTTTQSQRIGRPESLPWKTELPFLVEARKNGMTYAELADALADRYGKALTPQSVRAHVHPHLGAAGERASVKAREAERADVDHEDSLRLAQWLLDHPAYTRKEAAEALNMPLYRVEALMPQAREHFDGYLIPPARQGKEQFSEADMLNGLRTCAKHIGLKRGGVLSQGIYAEWRENQPATSRRADQPSKATLPSPIAYRRRFGTWTEACEAAGLSANPLPRNYEGLSVEDMVLWMACWLRDIKEQKRGLVDASQSEYRLWLRQNPEAPSEELIRLRATWGNLLSAASVLEKTVKKLPTPKSVGTEGRVKNSTRSRRKKVG